MDLEVVVRQVVEHDQLDIVKLLQAFDNERYRARKASTNNNNNNNNRNAEEHPGGKASRKIDWESRLPRLRIDKRGGLYLEPFLDSNKAYFHCYVAENKSDNAVIGYILFFNTLDSRNGSRSFPDSPLAVIEDLYVKPRFRRRRIGTELVKRVLRSSLDRGCHGCEFAYFARSNECISFWKTVLGSSLDGNLAKTSPKEDSFEEVIQLDKSEMERCYSRDNDA